MNNNHLPTLPTLSGLLDDVNAALSLSEDDFNSLDEYDDALDEAAIEPLSIETEKVVRVVLCTGGPHAEVRFVFRGDELAYAEHVAIWGANRHTTPLSDDEADTLMHYFAIGFA